MKKKGLNGGEKVLDLFKEMNWTNPLLFFSVGRESWRTRTDKKENKISS
jgi:hypothetical protein